MRRLSLFAAVLALAACQSGPTAPDPASAGVAPRHSTGYLGSGYRTDSTGTASSTLVGSGYRDGSGEPTAAAPSSGYMGSGY